ncbi:hypothetical protein Ctob_014101 [Chrysochromulina tobinii]|uniref:Uncharacterized protein n=1 Tax=Chrysochromulina tobinii TaxID=1460289 RepID=A0A0M0K9H7_9EUKA|nr:hypothetical protein Ctob_014101 [Chrysochromulina tobinii]|eukprot:KOO35501.1 hypothetical protein Ctob_014101 [Chrysochromulina sp. CCMP291]
MLALGSTPAQCQSPVCLKRTPPLEELLRRALNHRIRV